MNRNSEQQDHPRVCGEKLFYAFYHVPCPGSPPRVRGKGIAYMRLSCLVRITPACAGKRKSYSKHKKHHRDHPRVCGEKARTLIAWEEPQGSPPRVRGKESNAKTGQKARRITPACAGKRASSFHSMLTRWDHPRVCGEKQLGKNATDYTLGSPPRVRGKAEVFSFKCHVIGITPACAGKSCDRSGSAPRTGDHPRVCGEKLCKMYKSPEIQGSPPRVRGKVVAEAVHDQVDGITPACAGKSWN